MKRHAFESIAFDFSVQSRTVANNVLERLSAFWWAEMETIIETSIDDTIGSEADLILDRLMLDLGDLPEVGMEAVLAERLAACLRSEFSRAARHSNAGTRYEEPENLDTLENSAPPRSLTTLETYLLTGNLPSILAGPSASIDSLLATALDSEPARLTTLLRRIMCWDQFRQRLFLQSRPETRERLIPQLSGPRYAQLDRFRKQVLQGPTQDAGKPTPVQDFEETLQASLLSELLNLPAGSGLDQHFFRAIADTMALTFDSDHAESHARRSAPEGLSYGVDGQAPNSAKPTSHLSPSGANPGGLAPDGSLTKTGAPNSEPGSPISDPSKTEPHSYVHDRDGLPLKVRVPPSESLAPTTGPRQVEPPASLLDGPSHGAAAPTSRSAAAASDPDQTRSHASKSIPEAHLTRSAATPPEPAAPTSDRGRTEPDITEPTLDGWASSGASSSEAAPPVSGPGQNEPRSTDLTEDTALPGTGEPAPELPPSTVDRGQTSWSARDAALDNPQPGTDSPTADASTPKPDVGETRPHPTAPRRIAQPLATGTPHPKKGESLKSDSNHIEAHAHASTSDGPLVKAGAQTSKTAARPFDLQQAQAGLPDSAGATGDTVPSAAYADFLGLVHENGVASDRLLSVPMDSWFLALLESEGDRLIGDLRSVPDRGTAISALLRHLPWTALQALIGRLSPTMGGLVMTTLLAGESAGASPRGPADHAVQDALWRAALFLAIDPRVPTQDGTTLVRRLIAETATHGDVDATVVSNVLRRGAHVGSRQDPRFLPLEDILAALSEETAPGDAASETPSRRQPTVPSAEFLKRALSLPVWSEPIDPMSIAAAYLRYGKLPAGETMSDMNKRIEAVINTALAAGTPVRLAWLFPMLSDPLHRFRLVRSISTATAMDLIDRVFPDMRGVVSVAVEVAEIPCQIIPGLTRDEWTAVAFALALGPSPDPAYTETAFLRAALRIAAVRRSYRFADVIAALAARPDALEGLSRISRDAIADLFLSDPEEPPSSPTTDAPMTTDNLLETARRLTPDRLFVVNAGLVLLWPYLPRLFANLDMLDDNGFRDTEAQLRAVHLTQFLVTRHHAAPEHMLPLNKLLCGLDLSHPIGLGITPTEQETAVVQDMLYSVTQTWVPLQNTSIEGLRESFLERSGRLERSGPAGPMTLHVESRAFDMLLDQLPWSISVVKLNWMLEVLHVRWR